MVCVISLVFIFFAWVNTNEVVLGTLSNDTRRTLHTMERITVVWVCLDLCDMVNALYDNSCLTYVQIYFITVI